MFCTTLRRRSSFASTIPSLTSPTGLSLKESSLKTHDLAIPIPTPQTHGSNPSNRTLRFLLLSPTTVTTSNLPTTLSRLQHFASLTGGTDIAIIFCLSTPTASNTEKTLLAPPQDGLTGYTRLQYELLSRSDIPWMPILLLANTEGLIDVVRSHLQAVSRQRRDVAPGVRTTDLLASCTTEVGLTSFAVGVTSDMFPDLASFASAGAGYGVSEGRGEGRWGVEEGLVSSEGARNAFEVLEEQLGKEVVGGMLEFWTDDWVID